MRAFIAAIAIVLLLPTTSAGQEAQIITEAEFLAPPAGEDPASLALLEDLGTARAAALAARTLENPELGAVREAPSGATEQIDVTVAWEPPRPDQRRLAVAAGDSRVAAAEARLDVDRLGLRLAMREAFARWALAAVRAEALADQVGRVDELARTQQQRAEAGEASGLDARRLTLASGETRAELARAQAELQAARAAARAWRPDLPEAVLPAPPSLPPSSAVLPTTHPHVAALEAELEAARLSAQLAAKVLRLPAIVGGWQQQESNAGETVEGAILGLSWPLPLFDRNRAEQAQAAARVAALEARLEVARREVAAQRAGALAAYATLREAAIEAADVATTTKPVITAAASSFRLGEASLTDLLDTLRSAAGADLGAVALLDAALEAHRELERLAGAPLSPAITAAAPIDEGDE